MAQNPENASDDDEVYDDLVWAKEVLTVYKYLGKRMTGRKFSSSCKNLHEFASNPETQEKFLAQMVPKATDILSKNRKPDEDNAIVEAEKRSISELQSLLKQAVLESQAVDC